MHLLLLALRDNHAAVAMQDSLKVQVSVLCRNECIQPLCRSEEATEALL